MTKLTTEAEAEFRDVLGKACASVGLDSAEAEIIKYTVSAVYRLRSAPVIVRLRRGGWERALTETRVARQLAEMDAPVAPLLDCLQPIAVGQHVATLWRAVPATTRGLEGTDLALALRELHQLTPPADFPEWDVFGTIRRWIADADTGALSHADLTWLRDECDELEAAYQEWKPSLRHGLIHGDGHIGNLLRQPSGRLVLCDLDTVSRGPLLQDLAPTAVNAIRFGRALRQARFAQTYGRDITAEPVWPVLRRARELMTVTSVITDLSGRPEVTAEQAHRMRTLRARDTSARWHAYV